MTQQDVVLLAGATRSDIEALVSSIDVPADVNVSIRVFENDYIDEPGLDLESFDYLVDVFGTDQHEWARRVARAAAEHDWRLLWLRNGSQVVERRERAAA